MSRSDSPTASAPQDAKPARTLRYRLLSGLALVAIYALIVFVLPTPQGVKPAGWRLFGIFAATVGGLVLQPIPGGALVLVAVTLAAVAGGLSIAQAMEGFGDPTVWLVQAAFFISNALIKTGLARRIALIFVRAFGKNSLGVCYSLSLTDLTLAGIIPSNGARSGGVVLPIVRSICELYGSLPGPTAPLLGAFLMVGVYQSICVTSAMFLTGQASNPLAAQIAGQTLGFSVNWARWFLAGSVPGAISLLLVPYLIYRIYPPQVKHTPEASAYAASQLRQMGPMSRGERIVAVIFLGVCGMWATTALHHVDITVTALLGSCALLLTGVITWKEVISDHVAWDIFIWYGGLLRLGKALNDAGVTTAFAKAVGAAFADQSWVFLLAIAILVYFYAHYGFASITAHMLAMFPAFGAVLLAKGAPAGLVVFCFACSTNLSAGLTNYGTTPAPMFFAHGYVPFGQWWKVGFFVSLANLVIWGATGPLWWKFLGYW